MNLIKVDVLKTLHISIKQIGKSLENSKMKLVTELIGLR